MGDPSSENSVFKDEYTIGTPNFLYKRAIGCQSHWKRKVGDERKSL